MVHWMFDAISISLNRTNRAGLFRFVFIRVHSWFFHVRHPVPKSCATVTLACATPATPGISRLDAAGKNRITNPASGVEIQLGPLASSQLDDLCPEINLNTTIQPVSAA
jgi:hypothetical protein